jgi:hypothetical protein
MVWKCQRQPYRDVSDDSTVVHSLLSKCDSQERHAGSVRTQGVPRLVASAAKRRPLLEPERGIRIGFPVDPGGHCANLDRDEVSPGGY